MNPQEPLHRDNDGLDEYRQPIHLSNLNPAERLALARGTLCAANLPCTKPRAQDSLFCGQHKWASNRIPVTYISNDALAQKMGEPL